MTLLLLHNVKYLLLFCIVIPINTLAFTKEVTFIGSSNGVFLENYDENIEHILFYPLLGLFILFIFGGVYWNHKLSRQINEGKEADKSLKKSEEQMRMLMENIPLDIIVSTHQGDVLRANKHALDTFKISLEELSSYNVMDFYIDLSERDFLIQTVKKMARVKQHIVKVKHLDGRQMQVMVSVIPIVYNGKNALLSIMVDLTERIGLEEELRNAKLVADAANKSKSEFLANMSHEIRTPMNAIIGFTELLNDQLKDHRLKSYANTIQRAGNILLSLINDILDLSKIEAGKLTLQTTTTNMFILLDDIALIFEMKVREKNLDLILDIEESLPSGLLLDAVRLRQVLVNVIANAVKFTTEGYVKVKIYGLNIDEHQSKLDLMIEVEDTGVGIATNQVEHIFEAFEQQEGQDNRKYGGTGLGLSISSRLIAMMDGNISVGSTQGVGATFYIQLYGVDISAVEETVNNNLLEDENVSIVFDEAIILVVDDIEDNRKLILSTFEGTKLKLLTASDGYEAIEMYKKEKPDLILMDIRMPNMDGYEASSKIKQISSVPIIALTASVMKDEYERLKSKNFDAYLRKPVLKKELFSAISRYLSHEIHKNEEVVSLTLVKVLNAMPKNLYLSLQQSTIPLYIQAKKSNNMKDIKAFIVSVEYFSKSNNIKLLQEYTDAFNTAIDAFDIIKMQTLLREYALVEEQLDDLV